MGGYVKLYRQIMNWGWYTEPNTRDVFIHLLLNAQYQEHGFQGRVLMPGQLVTWQTKLASELGLTRDKVRTALNNLEHTGEISVESTNRYSIITVTNWAKYQHEPPPRQIPIESPADAHPQMPNPQGVAGFPREDNPQLIPNEADSNPAPQSPQNKNIRTIERKNKEKKNCCDNNNRDNDFSVHQTKTPLSDEQKSELQRTAAYHGFSWDAEFSGAAIHFAEEYGYEEVLFAMSEAGGGEMTRNIPYICGILKNRRREREKANRQSTVIQQVANPFADYLED